MGSLCAIGLVWWDFWWSIRHVCLYIWTQEKLARDGWTGGESKVLQEVLADLKREIRIHLKIEGKDFHSQKRQIFSKGFSPEWIQIWANRWPVVMEVKKLCVQNFEFPLFVAFCCTTPKIGNRFGPRKSDFLAILLLLVIFPLKLPLKPKKSTHMEGKVIEQEQKQFWNQWTKEQNA